MTLQEQYDDLHVRDIYKDSNNVADMLSQEAMLLDVGECPLNYYYFGICRSSIVFFPCFDKCT